MGSVCAFVMFAWLLNRWPTSVVSFLGVVIPVIAVILAAVVRHEPFAAGSLVGAAIVLVGVIRREVGSA
jgi:drug/metabolite transporter (DMT)-like permease